MALRKLALMHRFLAFWMGMEALERTRWIPCSERLPERNVSVLGWCKDNPFARYCPEIVSWNGNGWVFVHARRYVTNVTHWQPLPEPPEEVLP